MVSKAVLALLILCYGFAVVQAGTTFNVPSLENDIKTNDYSAEPRSGSSGRSLILKSVLLAPIGLALLLLAAAILFIPIPAITLPATGRQASAFENRAFQLAKTVLASEECIERVSCEVSRASRNHEMTAWVPGALEKYLKRGQWSEKVSRGLFYLDSCKRFTCDPTTSLKRVFKVNT